MREIIEVNNSNLEFFRALVDTDIEVGDSVVKTQNGLEVKLFPVRIAKDSKLTPEMIVEMHEEYGETFKDLVDR